MDKEMLATAGFAPVKRSPRRMIASIQGPVKSGKTRLSLTGRKPTGYIALEIGGDEGVMDHFIPTGMDASDNIQIVRIKMDSPQYPNREDFGTGKEDEKKYQEAINASVEVVANAALDQFYAAYYASLANFEVTVVDTGTDLWELVRLANFGRLERIPQLSYGQVNKIMDKLIEDAYEYPGSVLFLHHMKDQGETVVNEKGGTTWRKTGIMIPSGYSGIPKKVQAVIETWREDLTEPDEETGRLVRFNCIIQESRQNPDAMQQMFKNDAICLGAIGMQLLPGTKMEDWC